MKSLNTFLLKADKSNLETVQNALRDVEGDQMVCIDTPTRSKAQNRLYWPTSTILAEYSGYTKDQMNTIIKRSITKSWALQLLIPFEVQGEMYEEEVSTADLNKKDFWILIDYVYTVGEARNCNMIYPEMIWLEKFFETELVRTSKKVFHD